MNLLYFAEIILDKSRLKKGYSKPTQNRTALPICAGTPTTVFPARTYIVPDGWEKSEKHSTNSQIFYIEEGHENDEKPDNISIHVGKNKYSLDEHEQFRDAIVQQILMQLDGIEAQLNGDGTYTEQGDLLYIFTIDEGDIVTTQYYIVRDYGFCLIQLTNFSGSETTEQAARDMVDSFVWDTEG